MEKNINEAHSFFTFKISNSKFTSAVEVKQETLSSFRNIMNDLLSELLSQIFIYFWSYKKLQFLLLDKYLLRLLL